MNDFVEPSVPILRRSELERYAICPRQAVMIETSTINNTSTIAVVGSACHDAYSAGIEYFISTGGSCSAGEIGDAVLEELKASRPDVKVEAFDAISRTARKWAMWLYDLRTPLAIVRYDGGIGERSGQLSRHANDLGWSVEAYLSAELDCLLATDSPEVLEIRDWKTGWKQFNSEDVRSSFQFRFYAWLVLHVYKVRLVRVTIWNARHGYWSPVVEFKREELSTLDALVKDTVDLWEKWHGNKDAPMWPTSEKCRICDCASVCALAGTESKAIGDDPGGFVDRMAGLQSQIDRMKTVAKEYLEANDLEHIAGTEFNFGVDAPVSKRKPTAKLYEAE